MPYSVQEGEANSSGGLYAHSGVLQAAHAVWSDITQIGLVHALNHQDDRPSIGNGTLQNKSPFSKEAFHGAAAAVIKDHIIRYEEC